MVLTHTLYIIRTLNYNSLPNTLYTINKIINYEYIY